MLLKEPFEFKGKVISELNFRKPKVKDVKAAQEAYERGGYFGGLKMISLLTGVDLVALDELDAQDANDAMEELTNFLPKAKSDEPTS